MKILLIVFIYLRFFVYQPLAGQIMFREFTDNEKRAGNLAVFGAGEGMTAVSQSLVMNGFSRFDHESKYQARQGNDGTDDIELIKYCQLHNFDENLAQRKLVHQQINAIPNPQYNPGLLPMSTPWKIGTTKVAKNSSPMLPNNSENLSNWANVHEVDVNIKEKGSIPAGWLSMLAP